ncbi:GNAT family N-acetyltransferase [SAR202 cluster bacterium AD-802-E10_MRT_200m]|nr:GNAT family N-acetyltransferase [SAR202 cluster bacterium AD-802-E10_MRT_200m]
MIAEYSTNDLTNLLYVINEAAIKYKGTIPDDCWHEPYMSEQELTNEFNNGVRMFGYSTNKTLVGVMGFQELEQVTLIRHAYILSNHQRTGIGTLLLGYLFRINTSQRLLLGTWQDATWAIQFYLKNGFILHTRQQSESLLNTYWQVPLKQMEHSVVLEKYPD